MKKKAIVALAMVMVLIVAIAVPAMGSVRGDANNDGSIDMKDILVIRRAAGFMIDDFDKVACDTNGDNEVDMKDVLMIRKYVAGIEVSFAPLPGESSSTSSQETSTTSMPSGDEVNFSASISYDTAKYETGTFVFGPKSIPKDTTSFTLKLVMYKPQDYEAGKLEGFSALTGCSLTSATIGDTVGNSNFEVIYTYSIDASHDVTIGGSIKNPNYNTVVLSINGDSGGETSGSTSSATSSSTSSDTSTDAPGHVYVGELTNSNCIDLVTLTYQDQACDTLGVNFHSFKDLTTPVVQLVKKANATADDFASAPQSFTANETSKTFKEHDKYNYDDYTFYYNWSERSSIVYSITTYGYKASLTGLDYDTQYSYRVGDPTDNTWSPIYTFKTRPSTIGTFSFIYTADTQPDLGDKKAYDGINFLFNMAVETANKNNTPSSFFVSGGDFVYCSDEGQSSISMWRNMINGTNKNTDAAGALFASNPWMVTNGNHDNNFVQDFFNNNSPGGTGKDYYSYNYGNCHFIILDCGHSGEIDSDQVTWLGQDLAANASNSSTKWTIVFLHWSFYCNAERDLDGPERETVLGLFDQYGVDVVVSAHVNEDYYTTYPIKGGEKKADPVVTNGVDCYNNPGGTIYLQNAGSGLGSDLKTGLGVCFKAKNAPYAGQEFTHGALMRDGEAGYETSFMVITVSSNELKLDRYYYFENAVHKYTKGQLSITK